MVAQYKKRMEERQPQGSSTEGIEEGASRLLERSLLKMIDQYASPFNALGKKNNAT
jgi:hypothetical protein